MTQIMKKISGLDCIILVDDDDITNYLHKRLITKSNLDVQIKVNSNSEDALIYLKKISQEQMNDINENKAPRPGIIFLDINMPIMDGWEFIDEYKKLPEDIKSNIIITMLTTSVNPDDEKMANSIPEINYFLQKPLTEKKLSDTINMFY